MKDKEPTPYYLSTWGDHAAPIIGLVIYIAVCALCVWVLV